MKLNQKLRTNKNRGLRNRGAKYSPVRKKRLSSSINASTNHLLLYCRSSTASPLSMDSISEAIATLDRMSVDELRVLAKRLEISGCSALRKDDLITRLTSDPRKLRAQLYPSWWGKHHNHVYGAIGVLSLVLAIIAWPQSEHPSAASQVAHSHLAKGPDERPHIYFVDNKLTLPAKENEPLVFSYGLVNKGNVDAKFKLWDCTYRYTTDPNEHRFKYQPKEAESMVVPAIANTVKRGEIRFPFTLTPARQNALNDGTGRLFLFVRGEYEDESGQKFPLPISGMYDPTFPGNFVACPPGIIFE